MPSWSWAVVVSSSANACCGRGGKPGNMAPATAMEASSANSRRDKGAMVQTSNEKVEELERPASEDEERAGTYAAQRIAAITRNTSGAAPWMNAPRRIPAAEPART